MKISVFVIVAVTVTKHLTAIVNGGELYSDSV